MNDSNWIAMSERQLTKADFVNIQDETAWQHYQAVQQEVAAYPHPAFLAGRRTQREEIAAILTNTTLNEDQRFEKLGRAVGLE